MKKIQLFAALLVVIVTMSFSMMSSSSPDTARPEDQQAVRAANAQFYVALNQIFNGKLAPMEQVWSHADDITYMGPVGGFQKGWDAVLQDWTFQAQQNLGGEVEPEDIHITAGPQVAVVHNMEKGINVVDGETRTVSIRATNIFRKEKGMWKMIGHHTDLLPFFQK